jgi:hypothetical protein
MNENKTKKTPLQIHAEEFIYVLFNKNTILVLPFSTCLFHVRSGNDIYHEVNSF